MKKFMVLYCANVSDAEKAAVDKADFAPKAKAWGEWVQRNAKAIVDNGSPCGKTKRVDNSGVSDSKNQVAAYVVVQAEAYGAAAEMFVGHPHLSFFPSNWIEIMEFLPIPGH